MLQEEQIKKLTNLKELRDSGVLSEEEFAQEKAKVMSGFEQKPSFPNHSGVRLESDAKEKNTIILPIQIGCFIITIVMCILFAISMDPVAFGIIGFITAIITIILSWIKQARIPKAYAIISTVIAGLLGFIMLITP